ncbi:hypothetical protein BVX93_02270 [bacterium B13(2017)]|nr:hypothetical protein BVX93_02270 [bacterium B13(2017)]
MKIVLDSQPIVFERTGVGRYVLNLLLALGKIDKSHEIIPFYFNFRRNFKEQYLWNDLKNFNPIEVQLIPGFLLHRLWLYCNLFPLETFVKEADIYHFPNYMIKPFIKGKCVITVHDLAFRRHPETLMPKNYRMLKKNFEKSIEKSDAIITVSEFSKKEFLEFYPNYSNPVHVTYNGIDDFFIDYFKDEHIQEVKIKYSLPTEYILHVGTIEPRKNLTHLLYVFKEILSYRPKLKLVFVGSKGWKSDEFHKVFEELKLQDHIHFIGFIKSDDLPYIYHLAKLFIFPSLYEGFGMPPLEAMACGTPVIASDIPVMEEILGDAAMLYNLNDSPKVWANKINDVLDNDKLIEKYSIKGQQHAKQFTWEQTAKKTLELYEKIF